MRPAQTAANESAEWLRFNRISRRGLVYPERLRIEHPIAFDLILPGPATTPLARMLGEYSKLVPAFHDLVSILYLWCHSLGMREISPACLALLFVSFLQVRRASVLPLPRSLHLRSIHRSPPRYLASPSPRASSTTTLRNSTILRRLAENGQSTNTSSEITNGRMRSWHWRRNL